MIVGNVNATVRAFGERLFDGLLHAFRAHGKCHHFPTVFFFETQCFFQRVAVRLVHFEANVGFFNPVTGDGKRRILGGNLLDTNDDFHDIFLAQPKQT